MGKESKGFMLVLTFRVGGSSRCLFPCRVVAAPAES